MYRIKPVKPILKSYPSLNPKNLNSDNSPHKGRKITVYNSKFVESLMRAYVMAIGHNVLQKNQMKIGQRYAILQSALVQSPIYKLVFII